MLEKTLKTTTESSKQTEYDYNKITKSKGNDYRKMPYNNRAYIEDKRPSSMKSRYFSIENKIQETTTETQISNETSEKIDYTDREKQRRQNIGVDFSHTEVEYKASVSEPIGQNNLGRKLLTKMGWQEGQSLGKGTGITEPVFEIIFNLF